jgi:hypothetical protein
MLGARRAPLTARSDWREQCAPFECDEEYYTATICRNVVEFHTMLPRSCASLFACRQHKSPGRWLKPSRHAIARSTRRGLCRDTPPMSAAGGVNARVVVVPHPTSNATAWRPIKVGRVTSTRCSEWGDGEDIADCCPQRESGRRQAQTTRAPQDDSDVAARHHPLNGVSRPAESRRDGCACRAGGRAHPTLTDDPVGLFFVASATSCISPAPARQSTRVHVLHAAYAITPSVLLFL